MLARVWVGKSTQHARGFTLRNDAQSRTSRGRDPHASGGCHRLLSAVPRRAAVTTMAAMLEAMVDKVVHVVTNDGRNIVGLMKGFDQTTNIILDECHERVFSSAAGVEQVRYCNRTQHPHDGMPQWQDIMFIFRFLAMCRWSLVCILCVVTTCEPCPPKHAAPCRSPCFASATERTHHFACHCHRNRDTQCCSRRGGRGRRRGAQPRRDHCGAAKACGSLST